MKNLCVAVLNFSGNVGKTTVVRHILAPRLPGSTTISVETINADGDETNAMQARNFAHLQEFLQNGQSVVVDVGASNIEVFLQMMEKFDRSHEDFDYFIVPTTPATKQQKDTIATLQELAEHGVSADQLRVVFNLVESPENMENDFSPVLSFLEETNIAQVNLKAMVPANEIFQLIVGGGQIMELAGDATDFKAQILKTEDPVAKGALVRRLGTVRLARGILPRLNACFEALNLK